MTPRSLPPPDIAIVALRRSYGPQLARSAPKTAVDGPWRVSAPPEGLPPVPRRAPGRDSWSRSRTRNRGGWDMSSISRT